VILQKHESITEKQPEQPIKQNQLTEGISQQSNNTEHKQEDIDASLTNLGNKHAKGPHHVKGKLRMS
jgi:hypothetical protein